MENPVVVTGVNKDIIPMIPIGERPPRAQQSHSQVNNVVCYENETFEEVYELTDNGNDIHETPAVIGGRIQHLNSGNRPQVNCAFKN